MSDNNLDLNEIINGYLKHWKWFLLSVIIAIALAFTYLRYTVPEYSATAKIQILEDKNSTSELSVLQDLDILSGGKTQIKDEIEILNARSNHIEVVKKLRINLRYFILGNIKSSEIYGSENHPFSINFLAADSVINSSKHEFYVDLKSDTNFGYSESEDESPKTYAFGSNIKTEIGDIILIPNSDRLKNYRNSRIKIILSPLDFVAEGYRSRINVSAQDKLSNIVNISIIDPIEQRAVDYINNLIITNNNNAVSDKKAIADRTTKFINDRISEIYSSLSSVDETAENFKSSRGIADLGSQSNVNFSQSAAGEQQLQQANIQLNIASSMQNMLENQEGFDVIPAVGLSDQNIDNSASRYNELVAQRKRLLKSSNEKNPVIVKLDQQLESLKKGMQSSLNNVTNNLNLQVNSLSKQLSQINSRIYAAPSNERALRDISRKQQTTESLYLYLLQKREESQITFASATPKSKIVDMAYGSNFPVSPKRKVIYLAFFILGLLIPFSIIYGKDLLDNKIHNKIGLEGVIGENYSVLAEVPKISKKDSLLITKNDRSVLSESFRILRTNLDYVLNTSSKNGDGKIVLITSSVPGEGKTFVSSNLSLILSITRKRVLLLGGDIRNPSLHSFYSKALKEDFISKSKRNTLKGFTEFLHDSDLSMKDIVNSVSINDYNFDMIYSGQIPPNPSELLMSQRVKELFELAKNKYDYIIVDSAPLLAVTDTLILSKYADQIIYTTKAGVTQRKVLEYPIQLLKKGKLKNLSFIVNGVKSTDLGYGGKYGYGYGVQNKKWWQFGK